MRELILEMFKIGCIKLSPDQPFTYASGLKGPIYCDNRLIPTHPRLRHLVAQEFSRLINEKSLEYDLIAGVATAGITHASFLAQLRDEPMVYTRTEPKGHGRGKMVEGDASQGQSLLLVEDLINQGSSIAKVIKGLREQGFKVNYSLCIVDYEMTTAREVLNNLKVEYFSLINFTQLADIALSEKIIDIKGHELLVKWQQNPGLWS